MKTILIAGSVLLLPIAGTAFSAESAPLAKPTLAKLCTSCHKAEQGSLRGYFDSVAFKAKTIQVKIDDGVELLKFDEDDIKVINSEGKSGDGELLKKAKKGHEIKIDYTENGGVKTALKFVERPPAKVPHDMLLSTAELEGLVAIGPSRGKYFLYDARPAIRFQEGAIPTATNIPYSAFDMMAESLPKDKNALVVFYDTDPDCVLSSGAALKAQKLGYANVRVFRDGMAGWFEKNAAILAPASYNDAWLDKGVSHVLLDVRPVAEQTKGHIKGAVAFPAAQAGKLKSILPPVEKRPPIIIYGARSGKDTESVAHTLIKSGYSRVTILSGGFEAWQMAKFETVTGKSATTVAYTPQARPGEVDLDEFKKYLTALPSDVMIIDVRNEDELKSGKLNGSINIPTEEIKSKTAAIPKNKLVVTQCASGVRAEMAYHTLKELGYTRVKFLNAKVVFESGGGYRLVKE